MTSNPARQAFQTRFLTLWVSAGIVLRTPVGLPNTAGFLLRSDGSLKKDKVAATDRWVRLTILEGPMEQVGFNSLATFRAEGQVELQIFVPIEDGDGPVTELADLAKPIFRRQHLAPRIQCRGAQTIRVGPTEGWDQTNVIWPYHRDELVPTTG